MEKWACFDQEELNFNNEWPQERRPNYYDQNPQEFQKE